ncbi:VolA/Pla-1 family phospholipase [Litorilituus sediminis]|uniref:Lipase n=1 Tax=Litorilituus sediminis TaxID=718192 RepID=A0A4P6P3D1_9GAMM|nr:VolA/Pla-1 family phospholipase [Litorilituus sediminis]QBG35278.1 lipase [Litorilituus sediminis]
MKKLALSLAVISALSLSGCGSETIDDVKKDVEENGTPIYPTSRVVFDPANGVMSVPNDLLFSGSKDGTLNLPVADPDNAADPTVALSRLDGWSTNTAFTIDMDFPSEVTLSESSVAAPGAVRIFETIMGGDAADPQCEQVTRGLACKVVAELAFGTDFVSKASNGSIAVIPLKPLKPQTSYIVVLTTNIEDSNAQPIAGSSTYEAVREDINEKPLGSESQLMLQGIINSYEGAVVAAGVDKESIAYSMAMTTQSVGQVLGVSKQLLLSGLTETPLVPVPAINVQDTTLSVADVMIQAELLDPTDPADAQNIALYSSANYYLGNVSLPYYLHTPSAENPLAPLNTWMNALCDSGAAIAGLTASNPELIPAEPIGTNDAVCMSFGLRDFSTSDNPVLAGLDTERNLTKYNPIPKINSFQNVEVQMTVPDLAVVNALRPSLGLGAIEKPEAGWPVVILQHGIPSKKEDMLTTTAMLSLFGIASVAIDYPLFNSRGFDLTGDGNNNIDASVNPLDYINLQSFSTTASNGRQAVIDLLGLRFGLNFLNGADIDKSKVYFTGLSLGSIGGSQFLALANTSVPESEQSEQINAMFKVQAATLNVPMQGLGFGAIIGSNTFGPLLQSVLAYGGDEGFQQYFADNNQGGLSPADGAVFIGFLMQTYATYQTTLSPEDAAALSSTMVQAATAFQMALDDAEPMNYAAALKATETPILLQEVVGDGGENLPDQVLPNVVSSSPVAGTEPLIALLGLDPVSMTTVSPEAKISGAVRFTAGHHSSLINPNQDVAPTAELALRAFKEMQMQMVNYIANDGQLILISDDEIIK